MRNVQRKATKTTRAANSLEKQFQGWIKGRPCGYCGCCGPSIGDHARGATFKHNKTLIGHFFVTPKCQRCDRYKTLGNHREHYARTGLTESSVWLSEIEVFIEETGADVPEDVIAAIEDFSEQELRKYGE